MDDKRYLVRLYDTWFQDYQYAKDRYFPSEETALTYAYTLAHDYMTVNEFDEYDYEVELFIKDLGMGTYNGYAYIVDEGEGVYDVEYMY